MGNKRGSRCPDCNGPHGRGYYMCPTPYKNQPIPPVDEPVPLKDEDHLQSEFERYYGSPIVAWERWEAWQWAIDAYRMSMPQRGDV